ncbi:MAG: hypothetical protein JSR21_00055 [Proteobacteria bacterium]|nr:hypothetical protein [Pseudomonadota bacterium]
MIDAYTIGISIALDDGVSEGIAQIRRELVALDAATKSTISQIDLLRQVAATVTIPPVVHVAQPQAAAIAPPGHPAMPDLRPVPEHDHDAAGPVAPSEQTGIGSQAAPAGDARHAAQEAGRLDARKQSAPILESPALASEAPRMTGGADSPGIVTASPSTPAAAPIPAANHTPSTADVPLQDPAPERVSTHAAPLEPERRTAPIQGADLAGREPSSPPARLNDARAGQSTSSSTLPAQLPPIAPDARPIAASPAVRPSPPPINAVPSAPSAPAAAVMPPLARATAPVEPPRRHPVTEPAGQASARSLPGDVAPTSPSAAAGSFHGEILLDGLALGRWITRYLERQVGRPPAGQTGFDTRMSPTWAGAPADN